VELVVVVVVVPVAGAAHQLPPPSTSLWGKAWLIAMGELKPGPDKKRGRSRAETGRRGAATMA
jgi:hypothetical protein